MNIHDNERIDVVNDDLSLIQKTDGLTFGTDALLLAAYIGSGYKTGLELGSGSGIISMLILSRAKCERITALEVQESYANLTSRNANLNGLSERLSVINSDVRDYRSAGEFELVFSNPPYMKSSSGKRNEKSEKNAARHEVFGDIFDFLHSAKRNLKYGGDFYCVYRPDRMTDLISAMRENKIEPKIITAVHANSESAPSMILVMGRHGGGASMKLTKPFYIYRDKENKVYSSDMEYIMENGCFPPEFTQRNAR